MQISERVASVLDLQGKRVAIITAGPSNNAAGGAERLYSGLLEGFKALGCIAELVAVEADEPDFESIISNYRKCSELDLSSYDLVISTKVPSYAVKHPCHVVYLVHTVRVFDDMFANVFCPPTEQNYWQRARVHRLDFESILTAQARYAIGHEVARRLYRWRGLACEVLHPPLERSHYMAGLQGDYFFLPGRLHPWKRVDLLIAAIKRSSVPMRLVLAGVGEDEQRLKALADGDARISFLGRVDEERLIQLYADCLAVPFVPLREDYGYVTIEAFASGKPVLTCFDSGEPCHFVRPFETGLIVEPTPLDVQQGLEWLWQHREEAAVMGKKAQDSTSNLSWKDTALRLASAALNQVEQSSTYVTPVSVIDMQPIHPPVGGGRLRLLGLYHNLCADIECTYVGTYDWPGESFRSHMLSETLWEIDVPLSGAHHAVAADLARQASGKVLIDLAFSQQAHLSQDYLKAVKKQLASSEIAIFSHPWVYPLVRNCLRPEQVVIYDAHNVEGYLRAQLLDEKNPVELDVLLNVIQNENDIGWAADWILACSQEDLLRFHRVYGFPLEKMRVVPNGVMAFRDPLPSSDLRLAARKDLGIDTEAYLAIFIGSLYGPNVQAAEFIVQQLAPIMPHVTFVVAGGVSDGMQSGLPNVNLVGRMDEDEKRRWLYASDIAVNPMMSGSGTNIKMFDFMAMGLPVVTTSIGARGIETGGRPAMAVVDSTPSSMAEAIDRLQDGHLRSTIGREARLCVESGYSWENISRQLGCFIDARHRLAGQSKPFFSIVVPTYDRHLQLEKLLHSLQDQVERDFEVIIVDQSDFRYAGADNIYGYPATYYHTPVRGAVRARNTGAMIAQGQIIAFLDDDCLPAVDWLLNARAYFDNPETVGVEGLIHSDHLSDPDWRPVTNIDFEGIGFMTANLLVRSSIFQYLGGFDLQFDHPHFREDTDLGWRMQEIGEVPYANNVKVFHPAHSRMSERESAASREKFFQKDALLYSKHPEKYRRLFMLERHYQNTPGFSQNLLLGFSALDVPPPEWMLDLL